MDDRKRSLFFVVFLSRRSCFFIRLGSFSHVSRVLAVQGGAMGRGGGVHMGGRRVSRDSFCFESSFSFKNRVYFNLFKKIIK